MNEILKELGFIDQYQKSSPTPEPPKPITISELIELESSIPWIEENKLRMRATVMKGQSTSGGINLYEEDAIANLGLERNYSSGGSDAYLKEETGLKQVEIKGCGNHGSIDPKSKEGKRNKSPLTLKFHDLNINRLNEFVDEDYYLIVAMYNIHNPNLREFTLQMKFNREVYNIMKNQFKGSTKKTTELTWNQWKLCDDLKMIRCTSIDQDIYYKPLYNLLMELKHKMKK
jgi:hypothetical protein